MARYKCPGCGAAYNGKRCRECYYEAFSEEIAHGNHVHAGEPLVIDAPVRRPIRRKDPFGCERKTRKSSRSLGVVIALILALIGVIGDVMDTYMDSADTLLAAPEPDFTVPESAVILYSDAGLTVRMDWQEGTPWPGELPLYLENRTGLEVNAIAETITVNGYVMDEAYLFSTASDRKVGLFRLHIPESALEKAGIATVAEVSFRMYFYDEENYETIAETDYFHLRTDVPEDFLQPVDDSGTLLWEKDGIRVICKGFVPDDHAPEDPSQGVIRFLVENTADMPMSVYSEAVTVNGEEADLFFWCELPPDTRCLTDMYLHSLEVSSLAKIDSFCLTIGINDVKYWDAYAVSYDYHATTGEILLDIS